SVSRRPSASLLGSAAIPNRAASWTSSSRTTRARAACCQATTGWSAGWFCISRAIASRAMIMPFTLTVLGADPEPWVTLLSITVVMALLRRRQPSPYAAVAHTGRRMFRPHHLISAPAEIPDRSAEHVNQPCERKRQEQRHAEEQMCLEDRMDIGNQRGG